MSEKGEPMSRREFLRRGGAGLAGLALTGAAGSSAAQTRPPNLLFINVDQLHADALSTLGCTHVRTPNLDRLAARGMTFTRSYSANPVCCPARSSWFTGRATCETGVVMNEWRIAEDMPDLGQWLGARGYESVYAGKWHVPGRPLAKSFRVLTYGQLYGELSDAMISRSGEAFLHSYDGDNPFFLCLGLFQPHDCCYWVFEHTPPLGELPYPRIADDLPPLPANFDYDPAEPEFFAQVWRQRRPFLEQWTETHWRYYLWSYYRMVEMMDADVGRVLDALEDSGHADDTLVIFSVDHGDGLARHRMVSKMFLYDEAARVPLIVSWPGHVAEGVRDDTHLVSGLDLPATLTDYAGVEPLPKARGRSLRPLLEQKDPTWREFLVAEAHRLGRMIRTPEWKLIRYEGSPTEQLFDLRTDPGETHNLAQTARHAGVVRDLGARLAEWESRLEPLPLEGRDPRQRKR